MYFREETVGNDDSVYDVMILIKKKSAPNCIIPNTVSGGGVGSALMTQDNEDESQEPLLT